MPKSRKVVVVKREDPPGIVIRVTFSPAPRPAIAAFIWGGKVRPVPAIPYGRLPEQTPVV
jgi:hypothetical protein